MAEKNLIMNMIRIKELREKEIEYPECKTTKLLIRHFENGNKTIKLKILVDRGSTESMFSLILKKAQQIVIERQDIDDELAELGLLQDGDYLKNCNFNVSINNEIETHLK